jgi:hypothetical protein
MEPPFGRLSRGLFALLAGLATGVALVCAATVIHSALDRIGARGPKIVTLQGMAVFSAYIGLYFGALVSVCSAIAWWFLGKVGLVTRLSAFVLGCTATLAVWLMAEGADALLSAQRAIDTASYVLAGGLAGLVTWIVAHPAKARQINPASGLEGSA